MWERNLGNVPIADVAVTDDAIVVCAGSGTVRHWRFSLHGDLVDANDLGAGWHPRTDGRSILYSKADEGFAEWAPDAGYSTHPGKPVGNNPVGISPLGLRFFQCQADGQFETAIYCGSVKVADYRPTGIWEAHDDGSVTRMDEANRPSYAPGAGGYVHRCGEVMVGEGPRGGTQVWYAGKRHLLYPGATTNWPRVSVRDGVVAIVSWANPDGLRLWVGTLEDVMALPLDDVPAIPVEVSPAPAHLKGCGYFFRDTNIYPYVAKYGGRNNAAPGTHSVIVDDHGLPAEGRADGSRPRMIVGLAQLLHPQMPGWWDRVDAVYVAVENDEAGLNRYAEAARYLMRFLGLAPKPILSYSGNATFPNALGADDILGIQFYCEAGQGADDVRRYAAALWPRIQSRKRVAIIAQAFDRLGKFTGNELAALQPAFYEVACQWPNCEYLLWFSDARTGGTRDHEEMRPWHQAIADQIAQCAK